MSNRSALDVANYFLSQSEPEYGDYISNLKLQKLLYYAQGASLAITGKPLFDEDILNWEHGPVVYSVWTQFRDNGASAIQRPDEFDGSIFSEEQREILNDVAEVFGQFSAWKLRSMTHEEKPWKTTKRNEVIPKDLLKSYFEESVVQK